MFSTSLGMHAYGSYLTFLRETGEEQGDEHLLTGTYRFSYNALWYREKQPFPLAFTSVVHLPEGDVLRYEYLLPALSRVSQSKPYFFGSAIALLNVVTSLIIGPAHPHKPSRGAPLITAVVGSRFLRRGPIPITDTSVGHVLRQILGARYANAREMERHLSLRYPYLKGKLGHLEKHTAVNRAFDTLGAVDALDRDLLAYLVSCGPTDGLPVDEA